MRLVAYRTHPRVPALRPASPRREWMDETTNHFAYRCLPLTIGSQYGWELLCPCTFEALWTGGASPEAVTVVRLDDSDAPLPFSHFGEGVLTFDPRYLFRTEAPYQMVVTGPLNSRKDGIVPLTGVVETDWLPYSFTMNWTFTRVGVPIRFEEGEPFCQIFPVHGDLIEQVEPEVRDLADEPELSRSYQGWRESRAAFNAGLTVADSAERKQGWQRFYNRGTLHTGERVEATHRTRLNVRPFTEVSAPRTEAPAAEPATAGDVPPVGCPFAALAAGQGADASSY